MPFFKYTPVLLLFISQTLFTQTNCSKYFPISEDRTLHYTIMDSLGNKTGSSDYIFKKISDKSATLTIVNFDENGKERFNFDFRLKCSDSTTYIDYRTLVDPHILMSYVERRDMLTISGTDITIPNDLSDFKKLRNAKMIVQEKSIVKLNTTISSTKRKVVGWENLEIGVQSFDCSLISDIYTYSFMGKTNKEINKVWLAENMGIVMKMTYDIHGRIIRQMVLSKID